MARPKTQRVPRPQISVAIAKLSIIEGRRVYQYEVADRLGMDEVALNRIISGRKREVDEATKQKICDLFDMDKQDLFPDDLNG